MYVVNDGFELVDFYDEQGKCRQEVKPSQKRNQNIMTS